MLVVENAAGWQAFVESWKVNVVVPVEVDRLVLL